MMMHKHNFSITKYLISLTSNYWKFHQNFSTPPQENEQATGSSSSPNESDLVQERLTAPSMTAKYAGAETTNKASQLP